MRQKSNGSAIATTTTKQVTIVLGGTYSCTSDVLVDGHNIIKGQTKW